MVSVAIFPRCSVLAARAVAAVAAAAAVECLAVVVGPAIQPMIARKARAASLGCVAFAWRTRIAGMGKPVTKAAFNAYRG